MDDVVMNPCPMCGEAKYPKYDESSSDWCTPCVDDTLRAQKVEARNRLQRPQIVERPGAQLIPLTLD